MKAALSYEMREMDRCAIEDFGIPGIVLMERASLEVFNVCHKYLSENNGKNAVVVCGTGNNGGDGFAVARMLYMKGYSVSVVIGGDSGKIKGDALINYDIVKKLNINIITEKEKWEKAIIHSHIVVDAIFGTGFSGSPREPYAGIIDFINKNAKYVVSVDVPSGADCDKGVISGSCIKAHETVTFVMEKVGMVFYPVKEYCGKITIGDIGMPKEVIEKQSLKHNVLSYDEAKNMLPKRMPWGNKGTFGKVFVLAGSENMMGAAAFSAEAAYRTGCGLVYSCVPEKSTQIMQSILPEAVEKPLSTKNGMFYLESYKDIEKDLDKAKAILIGPGLGRSNDVNEFVYSVLENAKAPVVIDADGLIAVAGNKDILRNINAVITPHIGEMSVLTGKEIKDIKENIIDTAVEFAKEYEVFVVLKDAVTVIASPKGDVYINKTGNNAMSKGGSGDVLAGIITGLISQGMDLYSASVLGVYIHGLCGDYTAEIMGHYSPLARDLINALSCVLKELE